MRRKKYNYEQLFTGHNSVPISHCKEPLKRLRSLANITSLL